MNIKTLLALLVTIFFWASAMVAIRFAVMDYHPGSLALLRLLSGSVSIVFFVIGRPANHQLTRRDILRIVILGLFGMTIYQFCLNAGEITVTAAIASFILAQIPVFTTVLAIFFLNEKIHRAGWIGLAVSVFGVGIIAVGEMEHAQFDWGVIYIMVSVVSAAIYMVTAKPLLARTSSLHITAYIIWVGTIGLLIFTPQLWHDLHHASRNATLAGIYLGIFPTTIAYLTYNYALKQIPASVSATTLYVVPFVAIILGWIFLDEIPTWLAFCGGLISLSGAIMVSLANRSTSSQQPKKPLK